MAEARACASVRRDLAGLAPKKIRLHRLAGVIEVDCCGGGKWVEMTFPPDLPTLAAHGGEKVSGAASRPASPLASSGSSRHGRPRVEAIRTVDTSGSSDWAEFANLYQLTRPAALDHDRAKLELKAPRTPRRRQDMESVPSDQSRRDQF